MKNPKNNYSSGKNRKETKENSDFNFYSKNKHSQKKIIDPS